MLSKDKILRETSPLSIFFVKSGSSGNRLLFRYPCDESFEQDPDLAFLVEPTSEQDNLQMRNVIGENDDALCNMFSVHPNLCGQKFEIKINNVRHVGHPMSLLAQSSSPTSPNSTDSSEVNPLKSTPKNRALIHHNHRGPLNLSSSVGGSRVASPHNTTYATNQGDITSFNIVCSLRASASHDIVGCYHDLSKRLAIALSFEERRCSYLSSEIKTILTALEERDMANLADQDQQNHIHMHNKSDSTASAETSVVRQDQSKSVFSMILNRSNLARDLKRVFMSLLTTGIVDLKVNNWIRVSFCLPHKVHRLKLLTHESMPAIGTLDIKRCLLYLRPYHGILLLLEPKELLSSLPIDASPAIIQLIKVTKPDKNFMDLSVDANLTLMQIFCIVSQLVYWAKATVIYPICDSNIYAIHPLASTGIHSKIINEFKTRFPSSKSLHQYMADFSEGTSLSQLNNPLMSLEEKPNLLSIVKWLLQRRILTQVHKYIFLVVHEESKDTNVNHTRTTYYNLANSDKTDNSPRGIEIDSENINHHNQIISGNGTRLSSILSGSFDLSPQLFKNSLPESIDSSMRQYRADSLAESQDDNNFCLNSSLSSTPNSNLEYPSPSNDANIKSSSFSSSCLLDNPLTVDGADTILSALQRAGLSPAGIKDVLSVPASRNPDDLRLFTRLIPYFDGKHHVEDIMFFENLERSQVLILCDKFREVLLTCHYEDVAVSQLSPLRSTK